MAMRVLIARDTGADYVFRVHLDPTKQVRDPDLPPPADGASETRPLVPDPAWVREFTWGKQPPVGRTATQYLADIRREVKALCTVELTRMQAPPDAGAVGTVLASLEGKDL